MLGHNNDEMNVILILEKHANEFAILILVKQTFLTNMGYDEVDIVSPVVC